MTRRKFDNITLRIAGIAILMLVCVFSLFSQENPIIIIPGVTGSELVNKKTGEVVWFKVRKSKQDDLRLPLSLDFTKSHDDLVPGDILREVKIGILPKYDIYGDLIDNLKEKYGYHEERWELLSNRGIEKSIFVFAYDWRLDNVENARILVRKIEALKHKLKKPNLKFDVIAHSMGGLIARYAAMAGDADLNLTAKKPVPTWAGAKLFDKIILLGTPNEGSPLTLSSLINGLRLGGIKIDLPFVRMLTKFDVFTIPSTFQLLPAPGTFLATDDKFEPLDIDIYDVKTWTKYGWNPLDDPDYAKAFTAAEKKIAETYFRTVLARAKRLHELLAVGNLENKTSVSFHVVGADCKESLNALVVYRDDHSDKWKTKFSTSGFTGSDGQKVSSEDLKKAMYGPGDGTVTRRSLEAATESSLAKVESILKPASSKFVCEDHDRLPGNTEVQDYIMSVFGAKEMQVKTAAPGRSLQ